MRTGLALALLVSTAGCWSVEAPPPTPEAASFGASIRTALARGDIETAEDLLQRGRRAHPLDAGLREWETLLLQMRWQDEQAIDVLRALQEDDSVTGEQRVEVVGRLGELLFLAGRYAESAPYLEAAKRETPTGLRRGRLARLARRLPRDRYDPAEMIAELPLLVESPPELLCTVDNTERPFLLDTGATFSTLSRSLARELGIEAVTDTEDAIDGAGNLLPANWGVMKNLSLGTVPLGPSPVLIVDDSYLRLRDPFGGRQRSPTGLIGLDVLARFHVTFDPQRRSVVFGLQAGLPAAESVSCLRHEGSCLVPVDIEGKDFWMALDTGASHSSLSPEGLEAIDDGETRAVGSYRRVMSPGGTRHAVRSVPGLTLRVGGLSFAGVELPVVERLPGRGFPIHGVLGADLLMRCRTTFDRGRLRLVSIQE